MTLIFYLMASVMIYASAGTLLVAWYICAAFYGLGLLVSR